MVNNTKVRIIFDKKKKPRTISYSGSDIGYYPMWGLAKTLRLYVSRPVFCRDYTRLRFPLVSTNVAICIKSSPIVYVNHSFRLTLLNYYSSLWNLADSLNPCPGTRTFLVKTEGLGVLSISSLVFLPKELGDFQFNRSETYPYY